MNFMVAQVVWAGPGDETEGWMNILFVIILAVFWVVSGIIKATSKKPQERQKQPPLTRKPTRKTPSATRDVSSARPSRPPQPHPQPRPYPAMHTPEVDKALRPKKVEATRKLESRPPKPQTEPIIQDIPEFAGKPLVELDQMRLGVPPKTPREEDLPEIVLDYSDPEELTKAILHYEILGPPVSLRGPSHQISEI